MYAQALTIAALVAAAGVEVYGSTHMPRKALDHSHEYQPHRSAGEHQAAGAHAKARQ